MAANALTASDLGVTIASRKSPTPTTAPTLVKALKDTLVKWDKLADTDRKDGGEIGALGRSIAKFANALVTEHAADRAKLTEMVADRSILKTSDAEAIKALSIKPEAKTA